MKATPFRTTSKTAPTGQTVTVSWYYDPHHGPPWKEHDGHGIVSEWRAGRSKAPGERVLANDRTLHQFYDVRGTIAKAAREGWGLSDENVAALAARLGRAPTAPEIVAESVELDFRYLKRWCDNDWHWCGYVVSVDGKERNSPDPMGCSLWGIDSDSIQQFEDEAFENVFSDLASEAKEAHDAACRDVATV